MDWGLASHSLTRSSIFLLLLLLFQLFLFFSLRLPLSLLLLCGSTEKDARLISRASCGRSSVGRSTRSARSQKDSYGAPLLGQEIRPQRLTQLNFEIVCYYIYCRVNSSMTTAATATLDSGVLPPALGHALRLQKKC